MRESQLNAAALDGGLLPKRPLPKMEKTVNTSPAAAERLFPFVLRARKLLVGRERLQRSKRELQWILISTDISEGSREEIVKEFAAYPIIQVYTSGELERFFNVRGAKVLGFAKSSLAKSIYAGLKEHRINKPAPEKSSE